MNKPFQTRSEETGLAFYETLEQAIIASINDPSIWKISFPIENNGVKERIRLEWKFFECQHGNFGGWMLTPDYTGIKQE